MKLYNDNSYIDKKIWRCRGKNPIHDIKINIRINSIFEDIKVKLYILYYLTFKCFPFNKSINKAFIDIKDLSSKLNESSTTLNTISKIYQLLRDKIRIKYHNYWSKNLLGVEPSENGVPRVEIDKSKIISQGNNIIWMFGMIDRATKEARAYFIMNDRAKNNLLPLIKKNILIQLLMKILKMKKKKNVK